MANEERAHDLALAVVKEVLHRDFDVMKNSDHDGNEQREVLAASVLDEYNFYFNAFKKSIE